MSKRLTSISLKSWTDQNGSDRDSANKLYQEVDGNSELTTVEISDCNLESFPCFALMHGVISNISRNVSSVSLLRLANLRYGIDKVMDAPWKEGDYKAGEEILEALTNTIAALAKRLQVPNNSLLVPIINEIDLESRNGDVGEIHRLPKKNVALKESLSKEKNIRIGASAVFFLDHPCSGTTVTIKQSTGTTAEHVRAQTSLMTLMGFHPNIVSPMGFFTNHFGESHVVWEAMDGDLLDFLESTPPPPDTDRLDFALQLATALEYLHRFGVLHLALRPGNILYKRQGKKIIVKVVDFGEFSTLTERAFTLRSPRRELHDYLPPEIRDISINDQPFIKWTKTVDIWGFGIILYLLMNKHKGKVEIPEALRQYRFDDFYSNRIWYGLSMDPYLPDIPWKFPCGEIVRQCLTWDFKRPSISTVVSLLKAENPKRGK